jgi:hypothetical protein
MRCATLSIAFATIIIFSFTASAREKQGRGQPRGKPPQEAFDVCASSAPEASCTVTTPRGKKIVGQCGLPPHGRDFVCMPEGHAARPSSHMNRDGDSGHEDYEG